MLLPATSRPMPEPIPQPELLRSLGRLVRGLSALFWGLPLSLVVCFHTAMAREQFFRFYGFLPPLVVTGLLAYGLWQLGDFLFNRSGNNHDTGIFFFRAFGDFFGQGVACCGVFFINVAHI